MLRSSYHPLVRAPIPPAKISRPHYSMSGSGWLLRKLKCSAPNWRFDVLATRSKIIVYLDLHLYLIPARYQSLYQEALSAYFQTRQNLLGPTISRKIQQLGPTGGDLLAFVRQSSSFNVTDPHFSIRNRHEMDALTWWIFASTNSICSTTFSVKVKTNFSKSL